MLLKYFLILFLITGIGSVYAFEGEDTTKVKTKEKLEKALSSKTDPSLKQKKGKRDFFIDKDGDGICDNRAKGMGFERQRRRQGSRGGEHGAGNQGGNK